VVRSSSLIPRPYRTAAGRQAAWNLFSLVALTGATQAAALGTILLLTRNLGPAGFGVFAFACSLQPWLYTVGTLGTSLVLFREGIRDPSSLDEITTAYQVAGLLGSMVVGCLVGWAAWVSPISVEERGLICLIAAGNVATCVALAPLFDVHHRQPLVAVVGLAAEVGVLLGVVGLIQTGTLGLVSLGVVFAVKWWSITAAQSVLYHFAIRPLRWAFCWERLGRMLRSSAPLAGSTLIAGLPAGAGVFFVRVLCGDAEAGLFGVASQVGTAYLLFSYLALRILQPHIAGQYGLTPSFLRKLILFSGGFLLLLSVGGLAVGTGIVLFVLSPAYHAAIAPMAALVLAVMLLAAGHIAASYLVVLYREATVLLVHIVAALVYVAAALLLVPPLGSLGAALAAVLGGGCGTLWLLLAVRRSHTWKDPEEKEEGGNRTAG
jgi:O-antigen/teichoic acid export membrane protein